jgi:hypothetical protein
VVEEGKVTEFARAVRDRQAVESTPPSIPPTFAISSVQWEDRGDEFFRELGLDPARALHGEQEFEFLGPLTLGEEFVLRVTVSGVQHKTGRRGGRLTIVELQTEISDKAGIVVQRMWQRIVQPDHPIAR